MTQTRVARFEAGGTTPTIPVLGRLASALGLQLTISLGPDERFGVRLRPTIGYAVPGNALERPVATGAVPSGNVLRVGLTALSALAELCKSCSASIPWRVA
jgi:hypothetical protein